MNTRILGAVTAVTLVLPHRDLSLASTMEELFFNKHIATAFNKHIATALNKHIATELTINYHTVTLSNTIAIIVIFNYESSIIFLTHSFY